MLRSTSYEPIDYLVIGHITRDLTPGGPRLGGTAAFAALTAQVIGLRVGIVTSWAADLPLGPLATTPIANYFSDVTTTFENLPTDHGRIQIIHEVAPHLEFHMIPEAWRSASIVHLGPVAQEVDPGIIRYFHSALIGLTPQGWLRGWKSEGRVFHTEWPEAPFMLQEAGAVVISSEDVDGDESRIEEMAGSTPILAVTEAGDGSRLYWNGDVRRFRPPQVIEVDPTGAGDIYAAAFFSRLFATRDPWEAARFATLLSAYSVSRPGLQGIPTPAEVEDSLVEVL